MNMGCDRFQCDDPRGTGRLCFLRGLLLHEPFFVDDGRRKLKNVCGEIDVALVFVGDAGR